MSKQRDEIIKCGQDPAYFFNTYVKIQHPIRGIIPFNTYPFQDECVEAFNEHRFNIVVKSRQLGLSTLVAAYATWLALFHRDQNILIIATKQSVAQNIIRKVKVLLQNLPKWLMIAQITANNRQQVELSTGSSIKAVPTSDDAGRSEALSLLIIDEAAHIRNFDELWMGLYPTISTGGRAIILSSPNGVGGKYHDLYTGAEAGLNEFHAISLPWSVHPERDQAWFEKETRNMPAREIAQEHSCDFLASGDTFLNSDDVKWIGNGVRPPIEKRGVDNNVWIWQHPVAGRRYVISADVARGDATDFSTFHVCDIAGEVVAEYKGKMRPDKFAELLIEIGLHYNTALLCPENNVYGYTVCMKLIEAVYPKIYYSNSKNVFLGDYVPQENMSKAGFSTQNASREKILAKLEELIRNRKLRIPSSRFYDELKTFVWAGNRAEAMKGRNDDLVMSMAIGAWLIDSADGYSQNSETLSRVMLESMGTTKRTFAQPEIRGGTMPNNGQNPPPTIEEVVSNNTKANNQNVRAKRNVEMMREFGWLLGK